ncbi:P-loop containing nucleoside triphosphate hydrolase protein [Sporodiniella umbellata]|nr:P-loop containing nucleoside triphosphate hydrolase protein [Sporodiniella umbellata]
MARAKSRAGIPFGTTVDRDPSKRIRGLTPKRAQVDPGYFKNTVFKKPAGLSERLVQVPQDITQPLNPHSLKVAVIGAANAGKSTLINTLIGEEVLGVSSKAHTTRERVLAVLSENNHQIVFLDTPGVIPENNHAQMNRTLATSSWRSLDEADFAMIVVDAHWCLNEKARRTEDFLLSRLHDLYIPAVLVFNKMDLVQNDPGLLEKVKGRYQEGYWGIQKVCYTSALQEPQLDRLKKVLFAQAKPQAWLYPAEQKIEMPSLKRVEEIIRVEFFKRLHDYLPYMIKQENVGWTEIGSDQLVIDQNVYVERESQMKIVVGARGNIINQVVLNAREKIARAFGKQVRLNLQLKTRKK